MWHAGCKRLKIVLIDALGSWGCGVWWKTKWFQLQSQGLGESAINRITVKELLPRVLAVASWGKARQAKDSISPM